VIEAHAKALIDRLAWIITDAVARGQFDVADPEVTARAVFDATSASTTQLRRHGRTGAPGRLRRHASLPLRF
jgi:hypothetical protein